MESEIEVSSSRALQGTLPGDGEGMLGVWGGAAQKPKNSQENCSKFKSLMDAEEIAMRAI